MGIEIISFQPIGKNIEKKVQPVEPSHESDLDNQLKRDHLMNQKKEKTPELDKTSQEQFDIIRQAIEKRKKLND